MLCYESFSPEVFLIKPMVNKRKGYFTPSTPNLEALCKTCSNTEFFRVRIFPYSVRIRENTDQKKLRIWTLFMQWSRPDLAKSQ